MIDKWTPTPTKVARRFLYSYSQAYPSLTSSARIAEELIRSIIKPEHLEIHQISARVKSCDSMRLKLRRKTYASPEVEVTDQIGVRIITYYAEDVDRVTELLKLQFRIDPRNSEDKRKALEDDAFGYRSVHLVATLTESRLSSPEYTALRNTWFEIQVRSLLEHAWAEIEHEIKYKPRVDYPPRVIRRFARIAGVLELLDSEFRKLRKERNYLIDRYQRRYRAGKDKDVVFDSARLLGFLEVSRPEGLSWRAAVSKHEPFPLHVEASCIDALTTLKLNTARKLERVLRRRSFLQKVGRFAQVARVAPSAVSHLALILLVADDVAPSRLSDLFPAEVSNTTELREMRRPS